MELCQRGQWWPNRGTGGVPDNQGRALMFSRPGLTPSDQWAGSVPLGVWGEACRRRGRRWGLPSKRRDKAVGHGGSPGWTERTWGDCNPGLPIPSICSWSTDLNTCFKLPSPVSGAGDAPTLHLGRGFKERVLGGYSLQSLFATLIISPPSKKFWHILPAPCPSPAAYCLKSPPCPPSLTLTWRTKALLEDGLKCQIHTRKQFNGQLASLFHRFGYRS